MSFASPIFQISAADPQASPGTAAAGSAGLVSDAGHVHPAPAAITLVGGGGISGAVTGWLAVSGAGLTDIGLHYFLARDGGLGGTVYLQSQGSQLLWLATADAAVNVVLSARAASMADSRLPTSSVQFYLDESGHALKARVRYSDGVTLKTFTKAFD